MRSKLLVAVVGAFAFCCAFLGATALAKASTVSATSSAALHRNLAPPGTYAAAFGAPLCDDRAASAYAAEPKPAPAEGGEVAPAAAGTEALCRSTGAALRTDHGTPSQGDDLSRVPPTARDLAIIPSVPDLPAVITLVAVLEDEVSQGPRDGYSPHDNPPPRPIPWRS